LHTKRNIVLSHRVLLPIDGTHSNAKMLGIDARQLRNVRGNMSVGIGQRKLVRLLDLQTHHHQLVMCDAAMSQADGDRDGTSYSDNKLLEVGNGHTVLQNSVDEEVIQ
jgi:hypothetical protein